jgi:putative membrane protein
MSVFSQIAPLVADAGSDHDRLWWIPFTVLWVALLGIVLWFVARHVRRGDRPGLDRARDILAERFARGEVSGEEYRERLDELGRQR